MNHQHVYHKTVIDNRPKKKTYNQPIGVFTSVCECGQRITKAQWLKMINK